MKHVLVTGASHGLGAALARVLAERGHRVAIAARNANELRLRAEQIGASAPQSVVCEAVDLRDTASIEPFARRVEAALGGVDVVVHNAAIGPWRPFLDNPPGELTDLVQLNIAAPMLLTHALLPGMLARGRAQLISIASDLARRPLANMAPYVASKHALLGFTASLHKELRASGLRCTTVLPGIIDSAFNGAVEGSKDRQWALPTHDLAQQVAALVDLPAHIVVDEMTIHPAEGDY
ncbi:SDR family oxidoreductase [Caldimonas sp. KR1-144]|uniref:SDR family oxidoreductase n=1 Tax=Caldimonas sp. KR1-144 TaxID=3400911 RepID=UPI003C0C4A8B